MNNATRPRFYHQGKGGETWVASFTGWVPDSDSIHIMYRFLNSPADGRGRCGAFPRSSL